MNKEFNIHIINQNEGLSISRSKLSDLFQLNIHKHLSLIGEVFFIVRNIRSVHPQSSDSDYIENIPTRGGKPMSLSMSQNSFIKSLTKCMQCSLNNIRPHVIFNKAINLIKTLY